MKSKVVLVQEEIYGANILKCSVEHNGFQGGDEGHGGYVKITLEDLASTSMHVNGEEANKVEIMFKGDSERITLLEALKLMVKTLEKPE